MTFPSRWVDENGTAHEQCKLLCFLGSTCLGESEIDPGDCPQLGWRRSGMAYYCTECGDVWARLILINSRGEREPLDVSSNSCERHREQYGIAGSLLSCFRGDGYIDYLPLAAIKREFLLHLKQMENENELSVY